MSVSILKNAGLTSVQSEIYDYLLNNGEFKASMIAKNINRPRGVVYKGLEELIELKLVEKRDDINMISLFRAEHPSKIENLFENKEKRLKNNVKNYLSELPDLVSTYNLVFDKPGVKYYEGLNGVIKVLENIQVKFKPDTEIISFTKILSGDPQENLEQAIDVFIKKRIEKTVKTRVIAVDAPEVRIMKEKDNEYLRETRITASDKLSLDFPGGEMFIYADEIFITTTANDNHFAFSIYNKNIAAMLRSFFESLWALLPASR